MVSTTRFSQIGSGIAICNPIRLGDLHQFFEQPARLSAKGFPPGFDLCEPISHESDRWPFRAPESQRNRPKDTKSHHTPVEPDAGAASGRELVISCHLFRKCEP